jgi:uncharacterized protein (DUF305 family)
MQQARDAAPERFDAVFIRLMSEHHRGAVRMADQQWRSRGDLRLRIMAHAIRHEQQGEIALMEGARGMAAVSTAISNMFADNVSGSGEAGAR